MALGMFQNINIDKSFKEDINKLDNDAFKKWVILVFKPFDFSLYTKLKDEILIDLDLKYIDVINQHLVEEKKLERHFLNALKNMLLSLEIRSKVYIAMDELTQYVYKYTKSLDQMITERLRQYKLLNEVLVQKKHDMINL